MELLLSVPVSCDDVSIGVLLRWLPKRDDDTLDDCDRDENEVGDDRAAILDGLGMSSSLVFAVFRLLEKFHGRSVNRGMALDSERALTLL